MTTPARPAADRGYAICTSGRSGSNLLCQYLSSTGLLGHPLEYFNAAGRRMLGLPDYPDEPDKQVDCIRTVGATRNGIYGVKIFPGQLDVVAKSIRWSERLPGLRFVRLARRDLLGQAISWSRALQTGQWQSTVPARAPAVYDAHQIHQCLRAAASDVARWDVFFARNGVGPAAIVYEELVADPQAAVDRVASLFGLCGVARIAPDKVHLAVQRDATTEEWRARFRAERRNLDAIDKL